MSKRVCTIVATDRGFLGNGRAGSPVCYFMDAPWPWQIKRFKRFGEKTIDKIMTKYADEKMESVHVYEGDKIRMTHGGVEVTRPDGRVSILRRP